MTDIVERLQQRIAWHSEGRRVGESPDADELLHVACKREIERLRAENNACEAREEHAMTDIVERLRDEDHLWDWNIATEAAAEIERLRSENKQLLHEIERLRSERH